MPKTRDTRKHKALELLRTATEGPHVFEPPDYVISEKEFKQRYKPWSESWIIPRLKELIPELRSANKSR